MKAASLKMIKEELRQLNDPDLLNIVLRLAKFKKENKELLTYLLVLADDEEQFKQEIKDEMDQEFDEINKSSYYFIKKSMRKVLRNIKKYSRYSGKKETEVELLLYFLLKMKDFRPPIQRNAALQNLYERQLLLAKKLINQLHEDLQFDLNMELHELESS